MKLTNKILKMVTGGKGSAESPDLPPRSQAVRVETQVVVKTKKLEGTTP